MSFRDLSLALALVLAGAASVATPPAPVPVSPSQETAAPNPSTLLSVLAQTVTAQRVLAVGLPSDSPSVPAPPEGADLLHKLQEIGEGLGPDGGDLIPFRVGGALVLAPEFREDPTARFDDLSPDSLLWRGDALNAFLAALTPEQVRQIGSGEGLSCAGLSDTAKSLLLQALRPPLKVVKYREPTASETVNDDLVETVRWLREKQDLSLLRVHGTLEASGVSILAGDTGAAAIERRPLPGTLEFRTDRPAPENDFGPEMEAPPLPEVPNTFKPSDLDGAKLVQPIGLSGVRPLSEVLKRIHTVTGLDLAAAPYYRDLPVFLGTESLTCGEVVDGLRLALTAAWRKLGDTYILGWDRAGLAPMQQACIEAIAGSAAKIGSRLEKTASSPIWRQIARDLPFAPDDPLSLTPDQRRIALSAASGGADAGDGNISFDSMTTEQQEWTRREAARQQVTIALPGEDDTATVRPLTAEDLHNAAMDTDLRVSLSVDIPEVGRVRFGPDWRYGALNGFLAGSASEAAMSGQAPGAGDPAAPSVQATDSQPEESAPAGSASGTDTAEALPPELARMAPHSIEAGTRAVMVPVLGPARLAALAEEMKRHGFDTLFYPILYGGYTTFASRNFPLHPALRGKDGWAAAVAAMQPAGIRVVGYLNTLSWREAGEKVHWLRAHRDWLDTDVLGRTRLEWAEAHPDYQPPGLLAPTELKDYVSPNEPSVLAKLYGLVAEFSEKQGSSGIGFCDWAPSMLFAADFGGDEQNSALPPPPLGYSWAERLATFGQTGADPVDISQSPPIFLPASLANLPNVLDAPSDSVVATQKLHRVFLADLVERAKAIHPAWKTYVFADSPGMEQEHNDPIKPDLFIDSFDTSPSIGELWSIWPEQGDRTMLPGPLRSVSPIALRLTISHSMGFTTHPAAVVVDFRAAPERITESLRWVLPPGAEKPVAARTIASPRK